MQRVVAVLIVVWFGACGVHDDEHDAARSSKRLDIAKDFLSKHELEAAESESNKAIALNKGNDEAYNIRGLVEILRAIDTQKTMEIDGCLTGLDLEATQKDLDVYLHKADLDFEKAAKLSPDYGEAWANRGVVHNLLDDYGVAVGYLEKALENPNRLGNPALTRRTWAGRSFI